MAACVGSEKNDTRDVGSSRIPFVLQGMDKSRSYIGGCDIHDSEYAGQGQADSVLGGGGKGYGGRREEGGEVGWMGHEMGRDINWKEEKGE